MVPLPVSRRSLGLRAVPVGVAFVVVISSLLVPGAAGLVRHEGPASTSGVLADLNSLGSPGLASFVPVNTLRAAPVAGPPQPAPPSNLEVVVSFALSNVSRLDRALGAARGASGGPASAYVTPAQFDAEYGGARAPYRAAVSYFASFGVVGLTTASNAATLSFQTTTTVAARIFHTSFTERRSGDTVSVVPDSEAELPADFASAVTSVSGLSTGAPGTAAIGGSFAAGSRTASDVVRPSVGGGSYPAPPSFGGVQYQYASDYQVAYDELSLFDQYGDPTNASVALLTFAGSYNGSPVSTPCGELSTGAAVGAWNETDVADYFASVLPTGQPTPTVVGVPIDGAVRPGCSASWDTTGSVAANTVALETIGAVAPGATIYGVYAPGPASIAGLDADLAEVIDNAPYDGVSAVVTPWTFADTNDSLWYNETREAAALGITVVTAAGNSADDPASADWNGSEAVFPASMAYATFGSVAVGGATTTLNNRTLVIASQSAWNVSAADVRGGGPRGTAGGVSAVVAEPSWQIHSLANSVIGGTGRGVPDVAGLANNTASTVSDEGARANALNATNGGLFFDANGTGVAAAIVAGEFAEIDHALRAAGDAPLGFADPDLYTVGNVTYGPLQNGNGIFTTTPVAGGWSSPVPALPFRDVVTGRNYAFSARTGYDLVTGWGAIDAYNLTMYLLVPTTLPSYGPLTSVTDRLTLSDINVAPYNNLTLASAQANMFVANGLGAPVDWVQVYLRLTATTPGKWLVNFSASIAYPFFGIYSAENFTLYTGSNPAGLLESFPLTTNLTVSVVRGSLPIDDSLKFSFGSAHASYSIRAPGGVYILGGLHHSYSWQGTTYVDGPYGSVSGLTGFLAPQFGLYGPGGGSTSEFLSGTSASMASLVEPVGSATYLPGQLFPLDNATSQTGEAGTSLRYTIGNNTTANVVSVAYAATDWGAGVITAEPYRYTVNISQSGTPTLVDWFVNVSNGAKAAGLGSVDGAALAFDNGTYGWTAALSSKNYSVSPDSGTLTIDGTGASIALTVIPKSNLVTFQATGPTFPFAWTVEIASGPTLKGSDAALATNLTYAKYTYTVVSGNSSWAPTHGVGEFTVGNSAVTIDVVFALVTYAVKISPAFTASELDQANLPWTVTIGAIVKRGTATAPFTFDLPNGSYTYVVSGLDPGYRANPPAGSFVVDGKKLTIVIQIIAPPSGLTLWEYAAIAGGALVVVLVGVVLWRRRRHRREAAQVRRPPPPPMRGRPRPRRSEPVDPDQF